MEMPDGPRGPRAPMGTDGRVGSIYTGSTSTKTRTQRRLLPAMLRLELLSSTCACEHLNRSVLIYVPISCDKQARCGALGMRGCLCMSHTWGYPMQEVKKMHSVTYISTYIKVWTGFLHLNDGPWLLILIFRCNVQVCSGRWCGIKRRLFHSEPFLKQICDGLLVENTHCAKR